MCSIGIGEAGESGLLGAVVARNTCVSDLTGNRIILLFEGVI